MAKKNQSTYTAATEWWKHLRKFNKRITNQKERRAAKQRIEKEIKEVIEEI